MSKLLLAANHNKKAYGGQIVRDIEQLRIFDGERVALIGENGAGMLTLLSIFAGETDPDEGNVWHYSPLALIHQSGEARTNGAAQLMSILRAPQQRNGLLPYGRCFGKCCRWHFCCVSICAITHLMAAQQRKGKKTDKEMMVKVKKN